MHLTLQEDDGKIQLSRWLDGEDALCSTSYLYYCTASGLRQVMDEFNALLDYLREFTNKRLSSLKVVTWMKLVMMSPYIHTVHK